MNSTLITTKQAADLVGVHPETILREVRSGKLEKVHLPGCCNYFFTKKAVREAFPKTRVAAISVSTHVDKSNAKRRISRHQKKVRK